MEFGLWHEVRAYPYVGVALVNNVLQGCGRISCWAIQTTLILREYTHKRITGDSLVTCHLQVVLT